MNLKTSKCKITVYLICFFLLLILLLFITNYTSHYESIKKDCNWLVEEAIYKSVSTQVYKEPIIRATGNKTELYQNRLSDFKDNEVEYDHYEDSVLYFTENDEWEYRTIISDDKKLIGRKVNKKPIIKDYLVFESNQFRYKKTNIDSVIVKYQNILNNRRINIKTPLYIKVESDLYDSILFKNFEEESKIKYNHITPVCRTGYMDEIMYQFYLDIPFSTVYKSMDKTLLNILYSILFSLLVFNIYFRIEKLMEKRREKIIDLGDNNFKFGNLIFMHSKQLLCSSREKHNMFPQTADILLMFLKDENLSITKSALVHMLTNMNNVNVNLTRLRNLLSRAGSLYELRHKRDEDSYQLVLKKESTLLSPFSDLL